MRRWPPDYYKSMSWHLFKLHLAYSRDQRDSAAVEQIEDMESPSHLSPASPTSGGFGSPPPDHVLQLLQGGEA